MAGEYSLHTRPASGRIQWELRKGPEGPVVDQGLGLDMESVMRYCSDVLKIVRQHS
jgi:hypothetical protein